MISPGKEFIFLTESFFIQVIRPVAN